MDFDEVLNRARERAKQEAPAKRRNKDTPKAIRNALADGVDLGDHVKLLQHVLRARGFVSVGFDVMTPDEIEEVIRTSQTIKWQSRRLRNGSDPTKKGGAS